MRLRAEYTVQLAEIGSEREGRREETVHVYMCLRVPGKQMLLFMRLSLRAIVNTYK